MSLSVSVDLEFSATGVTLVDQTGAYDATTNPGGYGSPNAAFGDFAHYALLRKKNVNSVADALLTLASYDPLTATEFSTTRSVDGWYQGVKFNIPNWTAGSYAAGSVVYKSGVIYKANAPTSAQPPASAWDIVSDLTTIETNSSITVTTVNRNTAYNADVYWSNQIADLTEQGNMAIDDDDRDKTRLDNIYRTIQQVLVADGRGNNTAGEWCVLRLQKMGAK